MSLAVWLTISLPRRFLCLQVALSSSSMKVLCFLWVSSYSLEMRICQEARPFLGFSSLSYSSLSSRGFSCSQNQVLYPSYLFFLRLESLSYCFFRRLLLLLMPISSSSSDCGASLVPLSSVFSQIPNPSWFLSLVKYSPPEDYSECFSEDQQSSSTSTSEIIASEDY